MQLITVDFPVIIVGKCNNVILNNTDQSTYKIRLLYLRRENHCLVAIFNDNAKHNEYLFFVMFKLLSIVFYMIYSALGLSIKFSTQINCNTSIKYGILTDYRFTVK